MPSDIVPAAASATATDAGVHAGDGRVRIDAALVFAVSGVLCGRGRAAPAARCRHGSRGFADSDILHGKVIAVDRAVVVRFEIPRKDACEAVQLIVPAVPGCYVVRYVAIQGAVIADLARRVLLAADERIESGNAATLRLKSELEPPLLEIDVRGLMESALPEPVTLDIAIEREDATAMAVDALGDRLSRLAEDLGALACLQSERSLSQTRESQRQHDVLRAQAADALEAHGQVVESVKAMTHAQLEKSGEAVTASAQIVTKLQAIETQIGEERAALGTLAARLETSMDQLMALGAELVALRGSVENTLWRRVLRRLRKGAR